jgi:hypothetical protein
MSTKHFFMIIALMFMVAACATLTPEEKAAREAATKEKVKTAVASQKYKIYVSSMKPMRGNERTISGFWLKVDSTTMDCMLPYAGLDDIPHPKTRGEVRAGSKMEFKSEMRDYVLSIQPKDERAIISFKASDHGFECKFTVIIENSGSAKIHVEPETRDFIDYEGRISL